MKDSSRRCTLMLIAAVVAAGGVWFCLTGGGDSPDAKSRRAVQLGRQPAAGAAVLRSNPARPPAATELERFIGRWLPLRSAAGFFNSIQGALLAAEDVHRLGCGEELVRFIQALQHYDSSVAWLFHEAVRQSLTPRATAAQQEAIASITSDAEFRARWSYYAGAVTPAAGLDDFLATLRSGKDRDAARLGNCLELAKTDSTAALNRAAEFRQNNERTGMEGEVLKGIVELASDPSAYSAMEARLRTLPELTHGTPPLPDGNPVRDYHELLLERWIKADGQSLVSYINTAPAEFPPELTAKAIHSVARSEPAKAAALLQGLSAPEHFDKALMTTLPYLLGDYHKEAEQLAAQITSPVIREQALKMLREGLGDLP